MEIGDEIYDEIGRDSDGEQIGELLGRESHDGIAVLQRYRDQRGYSLLTYAVCRENLKALRSLVQYTSDAGIEIGAGGGEHDNLLIEAINGSTTARGKEILTYVLEVLEQGLCHVNIAYDYASNSGKCALHVAAQMGAEAVFLALSKSEGFPNQVARSVDRDGRNALHFAVEAGHRETVEVLLTVAPRLASQFDNRSETPLHKAVEKLNIEVLRYALRLNPHLIKEHRSPGNSLYRKAVDKKTTGEKMNLSSESLTPTSSIAGLSRSQGPHRHQRTTRTASYYTKVDNIVELLKERTLRCPDASIEEIRKLLYGDKHFGGYDLMLNLSIFDRQASNFKEWLSSVNIMNVSFDTMLKSVRLPDLQCQGDSPCTELHHGLRNPGEAPPLFNYLRLKHKVAEIFEIIVPDCPIHPHSNDAIRTSLNGFRVRHLDWRKKDLSLETVNRAAPNLESLCLYSSGNADVLGHWASVNGLGRFKELRNITITISRGEENDLELESIRSKYEAELPKIKKFDYVAVRIEETPKKDDGDTFSRASTSKINSSTKNIFTELESIRELVRRIRDEKDRDDCKYVTERRVKVAVIDSGIAANMFPKTRFQIQGASFLEGSGHSATDCHWHTVANSHGTMVVSLIEKMNPLSSFYIAKVSQGSDNRGVDAMAMIKALEWAIHEEVDIINISCTVSDESMKNKKLKGNLEDAIRTASNRSLIYCATADGGPEAIKSYPAGFDNAGAIAICTATQDGNTLDSAEMQNKPKWLLPGERLMVHAPKYLNPTGKETAGGSSSATALASGLASLILTLVRFSSYQEEDSDDEVDSHDWASDELSEQRLRGSFATLGGGASPQSLDLGRNNSAEGAVEIFRRATNMNEVFAKLCGTSKNSFVQPWTKLPEASKNWTIGEAKQQLRVIFDSLS